MGVVEIRDLESFKTAIAEGNAVFDCWATWCGPCKFISPIFEKLSEAPEFSETIKFYKIDVDDAPAVSEELGIRAMPTFLFFKNGEKVDEVVGASPPKLEDALSKLAS